MHADTALENAILPSTGPRVEYRKFVCRIIPREANGEYFAPMSSQLLRAKAF